MLDVSPDNLLRCVAHTLAYADVFDYPLTAGEVFFYLSCGAASFEEVRSVLEVSPFFGRIGAYFTLRGREEIVEIRKRRQEIAARLWPKAARYGRMLACLPFVKMVAVTGSLAVNNTDAGTDVDYMIVTAPHHLWTCRALALLIARLARLEGVELCPNYLVTTNALLLQEHSLYVAHELAQMIPLSGMETYRAMRRLNDWTNEHLPNAVAPPAPPPGRTAAPAPSWIQKGLENMFLLPILGWFEKWEMDRKIPRLTREQSASPESCFSPDVCKGHNDRHGESLAAALALRLQKAI